MWRIKILAKIILSRLPMAYSVFRRLGVFRHGDMHRPSYAISVVMGHVEKLGGQQKFVNAVCMELGPGDSLASALIAHALGARTTYLIDVDAAADRDLGMYREIAVGLKQMGLPATDLDGIHSVEDMLDRVGGVYLTDGLASLRSIPAGSVDLLWSHAVLEHVRLQDLEAFFAELRRVASPQARMSHRIDFMDHLGGSLNNLRFSENIWESEFMARSGFYTNRVRSSQMRTMIERAGFQLSSVEEGLWDTVPLDSKKMAAPFRNLSEHDLRTHYIDVIATPVR